MRRKKKIEERELQIKKKKESRREKDGLHGSTKEAKKGLRSTSQPLQPRINQGQFGQINDQGCQ
jgi:hypothetical protein